MGEVLVDGKPYRPGSPKEAFESGVAYLPQDRHRFGLVQLRSVRENVTYSVLDRLVGRLGVLARADEQQITEEYIDKLGIVTPGPEQRTLLLSGGNQQKVVFAKLAATHPQVLILHEPTQGVDVQAKVDIFEIINDLSAQGVAILIISSEVRELIGLCDRILVMYEEAHHRRIQSRGGGYAAGRYLAGDRGGTQCWGFVTDTTCSNSDRGISSGWCWC